MPSSFQAMKEEREAEIGGTSRGGRAGGKKGEERSSLRKERERERERERRESQKERIEREEREERLLKAIKDEDIKGVEEELAKGTNPNSTDQSGAGSSGLHWAAKQGNVEIARRLVEKGAEVNKKDKAGQTPLHRAAYWGRGEVCHFLVFVGASLSLLDHSARSPTELARERNNQLVFTFLSQAASMNAAQIRRGSITKLFWGQGKEEKLLEKREKLHEKQRKLEEKILRLEKSSQTHKVLQKLELLEETKETLKEEIKRNLVEYSILRAESYQPSSPLPSF